MESVAIRWTYMWMGCFSVAIYYLAVASYYCQWVFSGSSVGLGCFYRRNNGSQLRQQQYNIVVVAQLEWMGAWTGTARYIPPLLYSQYYYDTVCSIIIRVARHVLCMEWRVGRRYSSSKLSTYATRFDWRYVCYIVEHFRRGGWGRKKCVRESYLIYFLFGIIVQRQKILGKC